jgi:hypothetical protein
MPEIQTGSDTTQTDMKADGSAGSDEEPDENR